VLGSCGTVLQSVRQGPLKPSGETYTQIEVREEVGFSVPGSEFLPETGGPPLLIIATLGLLLSGALCSLGVRR
jgi:hypothetical protein